MLALGKKIDYARRYGFIHEVVLATAAKGSASPISLEMGDRFPLFPHECHNALMQWPWHSWFWWYRISIVLPWVLRCR